MVGSEKLELIDYILAILITTTIKLSNNGTSQAKNIQNQKGQKKNPPKA